MNLTHPLAFLPLQLAEEKLQLLHCDAVAGQYTQHVNEQVCRAEHTAKGSESRGETEQGSTFNKSTASTNRINTDREEE